MQNFRDHIEPDKEATYEDFEFYIYKINHNEEWSIKKRIKLSNYQKEFKCGGSGWAILFNKKNGRELYLSTVETYDMLRNPEAFGVELNCDKKEAYKRSYITLATINTLFLFYENGEMDLKK